MLKDSNISTDDARALFKQGAPLVETSGWGKINQVELARGQELNKKREKILDKTEMLNTSQ